MSRHWQAVGTNPVDGSRSPVALLPAEGRRALLALGGLAAVQAVGLILLASAIASTIASLIDGTDAWRPALCQGGVGIVLRATTTWAIAGVSRNAAGSVKSTLRQRLASRMLRHGGRDLQVRTGGLAITATQGLNASDGYFTAFLPAMVAAIVVPPIVGVRILAADWISALVILLTLPLIPVFMILIGHHTRDRVAEARRTLDRLADHLVELVRGLPVLVGLGQAERQSSALRDIADRTHRRTLATLRTAFLSSLALELIASISVAVVAVFIGLRLVHGDMPLETGLLVLILAPECYLPLRQVGAAYHDAEDGMDALRRAQRLIATPQSPGVSTLPGDAAGMFALTGMTVRYAGRDCPAVDDLSFAVAPGEIVALAGPSGCGKSTTLAAIAGLVTSTRGTEVSGTISPARIAMVGQRPEFVTETPREELAVAFGTDDPAAAMSVLGLAHAAGLADRPIAELSPGERRRVALARAIAAVDRGADLVLLDEPTAHLDPASASAVRRAIDALRDRHVRIILVAHDAATRAIADRVVLLGASPDAGVPESAPSQPVSSPRSTQPNRANETDRSPSLREVLGIIRPNRRATALAALFGVLAVLAAVLLIAVSGWLIVRASEQPPILSLLVAIVGVRLFGLGRAVCRYVERLQVHDAMFAATTRMRVRLWRAIAALGPSAAHLLRGGSALDHIVADVDAVRDRAPRVLLPPVIGAVLAAIVVVAAFAIFPIAGMVMLIAVALGGGAIPLLALALDAHAERETDAGRSRLVRQWTALAEAAEDVHANGMDAAVLAALDGTDRRLWAAERRTAWASGVTDALIVVLCTSVALLLAALARDGIERGQLTGPWLAALVLTPLALIDPLREVTGAVRQWPALQRAAGRVLAIVGDVPIRDASPRPIRSIDRLDLEGVGARWRPDGPLVVGDVSFRASRGSWTLVQGPSGSGKTTLLSMILGFIRPASGRMLINGADAGRLEPASWRPRMAWCPQDAHVFDSTLRGNLLLARSRVDAPTEAEMRDALVRVGLDPLVGEMPEGLDTRVGPRGSWLSGGQRQRLTVARALLARADVVLLDEPTAHLDREAADALLGDLRWALRDRIVVMVTHQAADIRPTDQVLLLGEVARRTALAC